MIIGIDARLYGPKHTGIGRYVQNLILNLGKIDKKNTYIIFGPKEISEKISKYQNFKWVKLETKIYSFAEQIINPIIFTKENLDLLHVPHFNAPIFYPGRLVITIHDLIKHLSTGKETTTLPSLIYLIKHFAYRLVMRANAAKAQAIITPANYWKDYLTKHFAVNPEKIHVTYEAVAKTLSIKKGINPEQVLNKYALRKPFLIYTGNLYPHKNVPFLVSAVREFNSNHEHQLQLALVCARDEAFRKKIETDSMIKFVGFVPDEDLAALYQEALALVQPSLIEGFGLTGLEAMSVGLPVLSSNSTCLPEVYADAALYFDPKNQADLIEKIEKIISDQNLVIDLITKGRTRAKQFSWRKMAKETLKVYKKATG